MKPEDMFAATLLGIVLVLVSLALISIARDVFPNLFKFSNSFKRNKIKIVTIEGIPGYFVRFEDRVYYDTKFLSCVNSGSREGIETLKKHNPSATKAKEIAEFLINLYYPKPVPKPKKVSEKELKEALLEDLIDP